MVPSLVGFVLLDAGVGMFLGLVTAAALIIVAVRTKHDVPIEVAAPGPGVPAGVLVIVTAAIEDPRTASIVAAIADPSRPEAGEEGVLVLAPARSTRLDRWADDLERARFESQRMLTVSLATLAAAGIEAEGRVGDGDLVLAAEDTLRSYAASEVVIVARIDRVRAMPAGREVVRLVAVEAGGDRLLGEYTFNHSPYAP
jgi:hypothetical protein